MKTVSALVNYAGKVIVSPYWIRAAVEQRGLDSMYEFDKRGSKLEPQPPPPAGPPPTKVEASRPEPPAVPRAGSSGSGDMMAVDDDAAPQGMDVDDAVEEETSDEEVCMLNKIGQARPIDMETLSRRRSPTSPRRRTTRRTSPTWKSLALTGQDV